MAEPNEGFEVVDKRAHFEAEDASSEVKEPVNTVDEQASPGSKEDGMSEEDQFINDVPGVLTYILSLLGATAWQWMGLIVHPATGKEQMDLNQARLAIDTFEVVAEKLMPHLEESSRKDLSRTLADLRLNYVERANRAGGAGGTG